MNKVLITGANKGIGFGISKHLALKGWHILVGARNKERAEKAIQQLKALGGSLQRDDFFDFKREVASLLNSPKLTISLTTLIRISNCDTESLYK